jgi:hypothetical protein
MHASSSVTYQLNGQYESIGGAICVNGDPHTGHATIEWKIMGDGVQKWTSGQLFHQLDLVPFTVSLHGVQTLTLTCTAIGDNGGAHSLWIEPQVSTTPVASN